MVIIGCVAFIPPSPPKAVLTLARSISVELRSMLLCDLPEIDELSEVAESGGVVSPPEAEVHVLDLE